jgi:hypothetical protein
VRLNASTADTFAPAADGSSYFATLVDAADSATTSTAGVTYSAPYAALAISTTAAGYGVSFTRTAAASATAALAVVDASTGSTVARVSTGTGAWSTAGAFYVTLNASTATSYVAPANGHAYSATLTDAADLVTLSTSTATYTAPYTALALSTISATGFPVSFTRSFAASGTATLGVYDATAGHSLAATAADTSPWSTAGSFITVLDASTATLGFVPPVPTHSYYALLQDGADLQSLSSANLAYPAVYSSPTLSSITPITYAVRFTRTSGAHGTAVVSIFDVTIGSTVVTSVSSGSWSTAGTYTVLLNASTAATFTAPADGHVYIAVLTDTVDAQTVSTASVTYMPAYKSLSLSSINALGYDLMFARTSTAHTVATIAVFDVTAGFKQVAINSGAPWTTPGTYLFELNASTAKGSGLFTLPTSSHLYFAALTDIEDAISLSTLNMLYAP